MRVFLKTKSFQKFGMCSIYKNDMHSCCDLEFHYPHFPKLRTLFLLPKLHEVRVFSNNNFGNSIRAGIW